MALTLKTKKIGKIVAAIISDVHLGHRRTKAPEIIAKLRKKLCNKELLRKLDMLIIAGDFFDKGLELCDNSVLEIQEFIRDLLELCKANNIKLRVLEGTPSHDRKQSKQFGFVNGILGDQGADFKYVDTLSIIHEEDLGLDFLYVPDECCDTTAEIWEEVQKLLEEKDIDKVDFCVMHGAFRYQYPDIQSIDCHDEKNYLGVTRYNIFIGHVHTMSTHSRIVAQGSFDRLEHGYEDPKGFILCVLDLDVKKTKVEFIINEYAKLYVEYDITKMELDKVRDYVISNIADAPTDSYFKLVVPEDDAYKAIYWSLAKDYPGFNWSSKNVKKKKKEVVSEDIKFNVITPCEENISTLVSELFADEPDSVKERSLVLLSKMR